MLRRRRTPGDPRARREPARVRSRPPRAASSIPSQATSSRASSRRDGRAIRRSGRPRCARGRVATRPAAEAVLPLLIASDAEARSKELLSLQPPLDRSCPSSSSARSRSGGCLPALSRTCVYPGHGRTALPYGCSATVGGRRSLLLPRMKRCAASCILRCGSGVR